VKLWRSNKPNDRRPLRVLVVEDSENDTLLLLRELRLGSYELPMTFSRRVTWRSASSPRATCPDCVQK
jgi:hypothetical protein